MSSTLFVSYGDRGFWAWDVLSSVLLKHLIDIARQRADNSPWLADAVQRWESDIGSGLGFYIDNQWNEEQLSGFCELLDCACDVLRDREAIPRREIESWRIGDKYLIDARGMDEVSTIAVVQLGHAVIQLVRGTLPKPPLGHDWCYGVADGPRADRRRKFPCSIVILEDNLGRQKAMQTEIDELLPDAVFFFFNSARAMIEWLEYWLFPPHVGPPALISLDHDLEVFIEPDGQLLDPGDGRDVATYLATRTPFCPVIVHTSNSDAAISMMCTLQEAGWEASKIRPENDLAWVHTEWAPTAYRLIWEWDEDSGG